MMATVLLHNKQLESCFLMIVSAHRLCVLVVNQHLYGFWLVSPQTQRWMVSAPYVDSPPRTSRLI